MDIQAHRIEMTMRLPGAVLALFCWTFASASANEPPSLTACAGVPDGQFVRSASSCSAYHYCSNDQPTATDRCPATLAFDAVRQACDTAARVDCLQCSAHGVQTLADPTDCRRYYACVMGERQHKSCAQGLAFDATLGDCNVAGRVRCEGAASGVCSAFRHMRFLHVGVAADCTRYVTCLRGVGYERRCPIDLYFNAQTGKCALPGAVNFCQTAGTIIQQSNVDDFQSFRPPFWNQQQQQQQSQHQQWNPQPLPPNQQPQQQPPQTAPPLAQATEKPPAAKPPVNEQRCIKRAGYNVVAGTGCQQYVFCIKGVVRFEFYCSTDRWFDSMSEKCERERPNGC